jgi:hypothetical protein
MKFVVVVWILRLTIGEAIDLESCMTENEFEEAKTRSLIW